MKKVLIILLIIGLVFVATSCSIMANNETEKPKTKVSIMLNGKLIEAEVKSYSVYNSGHVYITTVDGLRYETHLCNVLFVRQKDVNQK